MNFRDKIRQWAQINKYLVTAVKLIALFAFSALFLLLFSLWTSPFYKNWYGCDASFFTMAGRGIVEKGWVPYRDFFDLKGPYFFFLEALSQLICRGRSGAYIVQIFALFFALLLMIKTCRLFVSTKKTTFIVGLFLVFYISTLWGGNTLEEYALPLNLLAIYLVLRDLERDKFSSLSVRPLSALIVGVCFGIILFAKVTVASPIIGLVLAIFFVSLHEKEYSNLITFLLYAFLGVLLAVTPIFIYFYMRGMLSEMIYAVFMFAFKRSIDFGTKFNIRWELKISGCYFAIIFVLCQLGLHMGDRHQNVNRFTFWCLSPLRKRFMLTTVFCVALVTALTLHLGDPFIYYFTTVYPILMLTFIALFIIYDPIILFRNWRLDVPIIAFLITLCYFAGHTANQLDTVIYDRGNTYYQDYVDAANEMASLIPDYEKDSVYSLNMDMQWFECTKILPCYSYTINLQFFVALDQRIEDNIIDKINNDPPKWIVIGGDLNSYLPNIADVVFAKYENIYDNSYGSLYLLK